MSEEIKKVKITQSMMKEFYDYIHGEQCGLVFHEKYIKKNYDLFPPSDAQATGNFFEYMCIGATTKSSKVPQAEKTAKGEFTAPYKRMMTHVQNFKLFMSTYGIKQIGVQDKWEVGETVLQLKGNNDEIIEYTVDGLEGTLDLECIAEKDIYANFTVKDDAGKVIKVDKQVVIRSGQKFILDIKTTGLLEDKWSPYGWNLDTLHTKDRIIRQPIHYKFLSKLKHGESFPFLFLLFSQTNDYDFRSILFNIDDDAQFEEHKRFIIWTDKGVKYHLKKGFEAKPEFLRCHNCPMKIGCKYFMAVPEITNYFYQPQTT